MTKGQKGQRGQGKENRCRTQDLAGWNRIYMNAARMALWKKSGAPTRDFLAAFSLQTRTKWLSSIAFLSVAKRLAQELWRLYPCCVVGLTWASCLQLHAGGS